MSEIQEVDVFINPDGTVRLEVRGVKGTKCLDITKGLENLLGGQVVERVKTDEFEQAEQEQTEDSRLKQHGA